MAGEEDLGEKRRQLPDQSRHAVDDVDTKSRRRIDLTLFLSRGGHRSDRQGFLSFRLKKRGVGGPNDGADRYPEHVQPKKQ